MKDISPDALKGCVVEGVDVWRRGGDLILRAPDGRLYVFDVEWSYDGGWIEIYELIEREREGEREKKTPNH